MGAVVVGALPGLVGSAILSAAPAAAAIAWNPLTWIPAFATAAAAGTVSVTAAAVTAALAPIAMVGAPIMVGYAGFRIFASWKHKVGKKRNELALAVKDLINGAIEETRKNLKTARAKGDHVLLEFHDSTVAKLDDAKRQLVELERNRPKPERILELRKSLGLRS